MRKSPRHSPLTMPCAVLVAALALLQATACGPSYAPSASDTPATHVRLAAEGDVPESVKIGKESRLAARATPGQPLVRELDVPAASRLEIAGGASCRSAATPPDSGARPCAGTAEFTLRGTDAGGGAELFSRTFELSVPSDSWHREVVDLAAWANQRIELRLVVTTADEGDAGAAGAPLDGTAGDPLEGTAGEPPAGAAGEPPGAAPDDPPAPVDGPDEDGFGRAVRDSPVALWWSEPLVLRRPAERPPNVVLVSIDTLRADRLGSYGHHRDTSPTLDALAAEGVQFENAISQAPWTTPAHMSMMTSMYPSTHGVNPSFQEFLTAYGGRAPYPAMSDEIEPLAGLLRDLGYVTLGVTGGVTISAELGFGRGFDRWFDDGSNPPSPELESNLLSWLSTYGDSPFFLFFHTFEVHAPYTRMDFAGEVLSPEQVEEMRAFWRLPGHTVADLPAFLRERGLDPPEVMAALYDGGILRADRSVAALLGELRHLGVYDDTLIIVTSDHGEEFGDHDPERIYDAHCTTLYEELIRVPLILKTPGSRAAGWSVDDVVELVDIPPTVLDLVGAGIPEEMQGSSLRPFVSESPLPRRDPGAGSPGSDPGQEAPDLSDAAIAESTCGFPEWKALRTADFKYIATFAVQGASRSGIPGEMRGEELYDLRADPGEQRDLAPLEPPVLALLRDRLMQLMIENGRRGAEIATGSTQLTEEMRDRLRALGYIR